jgi:hypothetical protein
LKERKIGKKVLAIGMIFLMVFVVFAAIPANASARKEEESEYWLTDGNYVGQYQKFGSINEEDLRIITNNVQRMVITSDGKVGIGTASPGTMLDVNGVITASGGTSTNWNTAYSWGDHSTIGYLTSYAETDPVYSAWDKSTGISIAESQISDLDHFTNADETDQVFVAWDKSTGISIAESQITDLDHFTNADETDPIYTAWDKSTGISIAESQISDLDHFTNADETDPTVDLSKLKNLVSNDFHNLGGTDNVLSETQVDNYVSNNGYLTSYTETDPVFDASAAKGITSTQITNWDTAYNWGDHGAEGYDTTDDSWTGTGNVYTTSGNVGIGTTSPGAKLDVHVSSGGAATIGHSDNSATGDYAIALGYKTTASGLYSTAMGNSIASGRMSTAIGGHTTASGQGSTAMGGGSTASGELSTAMGSHTTASGQASTAMGSHTTASGEKSTAMGYGTIASGIYSTAMGREIEAKGAYTVAIALSDQNGLQVTQSNTMVIMGGNVGIGTISPSEKLDISGNVHASGSFIAGSTTTYDDGAIILSTGTDLDIDSGTIFIDNANDRVGIGTTSPKRKLHVKDSSNSDLRGIFVELAPPNPTSDVDWGLYIDARDNDIDGTDPDGSLITVNADGAQSDVGLMDLKYNDGVSSALYVRGDGKVGIGTRTPSTKLQVNGVITASGGNSGNWNTAYGWGDHSTGGYLTSYTETDPVFGAWDKSTGISIAESQITDLDHFTTADETDPTVDLSKLKTLVSNDYHNLGGTDNVLTETQVDNYVSNNGYLTSYTETDPVFSASAAKGITSTQVSNWDTAYGWGDHGAAGYDTTDDSWTGTGNVYTTSGNVGIGTTSPRRKLHVKDTSSSDLCGIFVELAPPSPTSDINWGLHIDATDNDIDGTDPDVFGGVGALISVSTDGAQSDVGIMNLQYNDGVSSALYVRGDGRVGIGTTNPSTKLQVSGDYITCTETYGFLSYGLGVHDDTNFERIGMFHDGSIGKISTKIGGTGTDKQMSFNIDGAEAMRIDNDGKVGIGTVSPSAKLDVEVSSGGAATIGHSSNSATGNYGVAMGYGTTAGGYGSTAMGHGTTASSWATTALGKYTIASSTSATAMGDSTTAIGEASTAIGHDTTANGPYSTAMGSETTASGGSSTAMGCRTTASGEISTAMGFETTASGYYSTAMGYRTTASGEISTAMGRSIIVKGSESFGIGLDYKYPKWEITQANTMAIMGGKVGIGTVTPEYKLSIGDGTNERIHFSGSTSPGNPSSGSVVIYFDGTDLIAKNSSGTTKTIADF